MFSDLLLYMVTEELAEIAEMSIEYKTEQINTTARDVCVNPEKYNTAREYS